jgi:hypothetical protein
LAVGKKTVGKAFGEILKLVNNYSGLWQEASGI